MCINSSIIVSFYSKISSVLQVGISFSNILHASAIRVETVTILMNEQILLSLDNNNKKKKEKKKREDLNKAEITDIMGLERFKVMSRDVQRLYNRA